MSQRTTAATTRRLYTVDHEEMDLLKCVKRNVVLVEHVPCSAGAVAMNIKEEAIRWGAEHERLLPRLADVILLDSSRLRRCQLCELYPMMLSAWIGPADGFKAATER